MERKDKSEEEIQERLGVCKPTLRESRRRAGERLIRAHSLGLSDRRESVRGGEGRGKTLSITLDLSLCLTVERA